MCVAAAISVPSGTGLPLYTLDNRDIVAVIETSTAVGIKVVEVVPVYLGVYTSPNRRIL